MATAKKRNGRLSMDELYGRRRARILQKKAHLLQRFEGQFVALYKGRVVGHGPDDEDLALRKFEKLGDVPFYIQKVGKEPIIYEVPSPEVAR